MLNDAGLTMRVSQEKYSEKRRRARSSAAIPRSGRWRPTAPCPWSCPRAGALSGAESARDEPSCGGSGTCGGQSADRAILQDYSRKVPEGQVIRTDPKIGSPLKRDTAVSPDDLAGPEPVVVPDVRV